MKAIRQCHNVYNGIWSVAMINLFKIIYIEIKKSIRQNFALSLILFFSIIMNYSIFIYYNDVFFNEKRTYLASHIKQHSVEIAFQNKYNNFNYDNLIELFRNKRIDYLFLTTDVETAEYPYTINSVTTCISINKNPYNFLFSTYDQNAYNTEPNVGEAYVNNKIMSGRTGEGLFRGGELYICEKKWYFMIFSRFQRIVSNV